MIGTKDRGPRPENRPGTKGREKSQAVLYENNGVKVFILYKHTVVTLFSTGALIRERALIKTIGYKGRGAKSRGRALNRGNTVIK